MAYITASNSFKIIKKIDLKKVGNFPGELYTKPIFFFSNFEVSRLLGIQGLLSNPHEFIKEFYKPIETVDSYRYIYEGIKPAYHFKTDCPALHSNYRNFEIPTQIRKKGVEEVKRFRSWFKENEGLLNKPDVFVARLYMAFGVQMNPESIDISNSGIAEKENLNLYEIEGNINKYLSEAATYFNNSNQEKKDIIRKYQKYTYLAYSNKSIVNNDTKYTDEAIKKFLAQYDTHFKKPVFNLLVEYYRVKFNPQLKFEGLLLEQLGFKQCRTCAENL